MPFYQVYRFLIIICHHLYVTLSTSKTLHTYTSPFMQHLKLCNIYCINLTFHSSPFDFLNFENKPSSFLASNGIAVYSITFIIFSYFYFLTLHSISLNSTVHSFPFPLLSISFLYIPISFRFHFSPFHTHVIFFLLEDVSILLQTFEVDQHVLHHMHWGICTFVWGFFFRFRLNRLSSLPDLVTGFGTEDAPLSD